MEAALAKVRSEFGREYRLRIGGEWIATGDKLVSVNPSNPPRWSAFITRPRAELARRAVENAVGRLSANGAGTPAEERVRMLLDARPRPARAASSSSTPGWCYEAGKTWPEAEADVAEAIDFCEYYAREMQRLAGSAARGPASRRAGRDDLHSARRGSGHSAVELPARHPGRHDGGRAGYRQYGDGEALERNPDHRRQIRRGAARSRLPGVQPSRC